MVNRRFRAITIKGKHEMVCKKNEIKKIGGVAFLDKNTLNFKIIQLDSSMEGFGMTKERK